MGDVQGHIQRTIDNMYLGYQYFSHPKLNKFRGLIDVVGSNIHSLCMRTTPFTTSAHAPVIREVRNGCNPFLSQGCSGTLHKSQPLTRDPIQSYLTRAREGATAVAQRACQHLERPPPPKS